MPRSHPCIRTRELIDISRPWVHIFNINCARISPQLGYILMRRAQDPRLLELKRLQLALDDASKHLDEFEARVQRGPRGRFARAAISDAPPENKFALHIVAGMQKFRQGH